MKKGNMKISFNISDEYGNTIISAKNKPIDVGINQMKGILNTKMNRKSGKSGHKSDLFKGL